MLLLGTFRTAFLHRMICPVHPADHELACFGMDISCMAWQAGCFLTSLPLCRAHKLAAVDDTTLNHIRNIYHMHRRMHETDNRQFKSAMKQECKPQNFMRSNRESLAFSLTSWIPRYWLSPCIWLQISMHLACISRQVKCNVQKSWKVTSLH